MRNVQANGEDLADLVRRRNLPRIIVVGEGGLFWRTPQGPLRDIPPAWVERISSQAHSVMTTGDCIDVVDDETVFRCFRLEGNAPCVAVIIDKVKRRGTVDEAAQRYGYTKRETDVVHLLLQGQTNRQIAARLSIAEHTVKNYIAAILRKCNAITRSEIVSRMLGGFDF